MSGGRFLTIGALERIVDEEREQPLRQIAPSPASVTFLIDANVIVYAAVPSKYRDSMELYRSASDHATMSNRLGCNP